MPDLAKARELLMRQIATLQERLDALQEEDAQRNRQDADLELDELRYRAIVEDLTEFLVRWKPDGVRTYVNDSYCRFFEVSREEAIGTSFFPLIREQDRDAVRRRLAGLSIENPVSTAVHQSQRPDGTIAWTEWTDRALFDEQGNLVEYQSVGRDITDRKAAEEALERRVADRTAELSEAVARAQRSEQQLSAILDNTSFLIRLCRADGTVLSVNRAVVETLGFSEAAWVGRPLWEGPEFQLEGVRAAVRAAVGQASAGIFSRREIPHRRADGSVATIDFSVSPIRAPNGDVMMIVPEGRDISQLKRVEQELRESERKYRHLIEDLSDEYVVYAHTADGAFQYVSPSLLRLLELREEEVIGRQWEEVVGPFVEDTSAAHRAFEQCLAGVVPDPYELHVNLPARSDGQSFEIHAHPILDAAGNVRSISGIARNITAFRRAEAELRDAKERAESADRVKSIFLATMSHELRTPLNSIIGFTGILLQGLAGELNEEQRRQLSMVESSADHLLSLLNDILDISKIEAGQLVINRRPFAVRDALTKPLEMIRPLAEEKGLPLRVNTDDDVGDINNDQRRLEQALINLLNNAVKFTQQGSVELNCRSRDGRLVIRVTDTGPGIRPEDQARLFQPFQQLDSGRDRRHEGTGLGLAISRRLVELMGGEISVVSEPGRGSTFEVSLPLA